MVKPEKQFSMQRTNGEKYSLLGDVDVGLSHVGNSDNVAYLRQVLVSLKGLELVVRGQVVVVLVR